MKWQCQLPNGMTPEFIAIGGPTASGKSQVAMELARKLNGAIICCDSVQVYRGFDIGSAKPSKSEQAEIPHWLFDEFNWNENCDAAIYAAKARVAIDHVRSVGQMPIVVGGTGLYLRALLGDGWDDDIPSDENLRQQLASRTSDDLFSELTSLDPRRAAQIHKNDRFRVIRALEINHLTGAPVREMRPRDGLARRHLMIFMDPPRDELYEQINDRTKAMIGSGLLDEVHRLLAAGVDPECKPMGSIGYREAVSLLLGRISAGELEEQVATATRQYARRQLTWFKKVPADAVLEGPQEVESLLQRLRGIGLPTGASARPSP